MSSYFKDFPTTTYLGARATDITRAYKVLESVSFRGAIYYPYQVKDHDTPDSIAHKYYGDPTLDWVIFVVNDIVDPLFQWPMGYDDLSRRIRSEYGSLQLAQSQVHHYERILSPATRLDDGTIVPERTLVVDQATYASLPANERRSVSKYDHEVNLNEERRRIRILDKRHLPTLLSHVRAALE